MEVDKHECRCGALWRGTRQVRCDNPGAATNAIGHVGTAHVIEKALAISATRAAMLRHEMSPTETALQVSGKTGVVQGFVYEPPASRKRNIRSHNVAVGSVAKY